MFVYADNAATTRVSNAVVSAMLPYFTEHYGNPSSTYPLGQDASAALIRSRETIAACLGCLPSELTFTSGGSEADNQILRSAAAWGKAHGRTHLIASAIEHHAVLNALDDLKAQDFTVTLLPVSPEGVVDPADLKSALTPETCLVSVMLANNETGALQPIRQLAELAHAAGALFHTDAVQAVGHIPISLKDSHVDFLSASAHKFHGPKGNGFLFAKRGFELKSLIFGGAQERGNGPARKTSRASWAWSQRCRKPAANWRPIPAVWRKPAMPCRKSFPPCPARRSTPAHCCASPAT